MSKVKWTHTALDDLDAIKEYIARDSVYYAVKFVDDAFAATDNLELFPEMGRIVPERNDPSYKKVKTIIMMESTFFCFQRSGNCTNVFIFKDLTKKSNL